METIPRSRFVFLFILVLIALLLCFVALFEPWYYLLTVKEQINVLSYWDWEGMSSIETLNQGGSVLYHETKSWQQLQLVHTQYSHLVSYFLTVAGTILLGFTILTLLVSTLLFRLACLFRFWRPKYAKRLLATMASLSFIVLTVGSLQYLDIMRTLREDQNDKYKGIPCILQGPCYAFIGVNPDGFVREWGPALGWISSLGAAMFSLCAALLAVFSRLKPRSAFTRV